MNFQNTAQIQSAIAKGEYKPHTMLTNIALAYYQNAANYFAKAIFPVCRVSQSSDSYYIFNKEDLLRDGWQRKPEYGTVNPTVLSESEDTYSCKVDQMRMHISDIRMTDLKRRQGPSVADPRKQRTKYMAESANIHQDRVFANSFFKTGVWGNEWKGGTADSSADKTFIKFSDHNSDPLKFIKDRKREMLEQTGREPNRLAFGAEAFDALTMHPAILERVIHGGTTANPADVTAKVLAELFGIEKLVVMKSIHNKAKLGKEADMSFIGDPKGMLLAYATNAPSIDEPSAGYIFTWDMLGDGQIMPIFNYPGERGTHTEWVEGLMSYDMKKTADDLAVFCSDVV